MEDLGKPSGITLRQHTDNVLAEGVYLQFALPVSFEKYLRVVGVDLSKRLRGAIQYHDEGKNGHENEYGYGHEGKRNGDHVQEGRQNGRLRHAPEHGPRITDDSRLIFIQIIDTGAPLGRPFSFTGGHGNSDNDQASGNQPDASTSAKCVEHGHQQIHEQCRSPNARHIGLATGHGSSTDHHNGDGGQ